MPRLIQSLYEDEHFIVFDKPAGILTIPSLKQSTNTLTSLVNRQYPDRPSLLHPCHRLDRDTSGVILFAWGKKNQQSMRQAFQKQTVKKKYIAFVRGKIRQQRGQITKAIRDFHQKKYARHSRPKHAITKYKVRDVFKNFSVVEIEPITGRTNQVRIHFAEIGHPLLGERLYAFGKDFKVIFRRLALHAAELTFRHPFLKKKVHIVAPLAKDMENFLRKY